MRIHLIAYVDPFSAGSGGGEAVLRRLIEAGRARGHQVSRTHLLPNAVFDDESDVDLVVMADVWNVPGHRSRLPRRLLARIPGAALWRYRRRVQRAMWRRYVHLDNAYVDICDLPYLPCNGEARGPECPFKSGLDRRCFAHRNAPMYERAARTVFLSPLHRDTVLARLERPGLAERAAVCRPLLDPEPFRAAAGRSRGRPVERLYLGPINEAKGLDGMRDLGVETIVAVGTLAGEASAEAPPAFAELRPPVPPAEVPDLLASARSVVALPRWPEPQGRYVLEAALAGCELIANDRVGALSFDLGPTDDALYAGAVDELWRGLEELART